MSTPGEIGGVPLDQLEHAEFVNRSQAVPRRRILYRVSPGPHPSRDGEHRPARGGIGGLAVPPAET